MANAIVEYEGKRYEALGYNPARDGEYFLDCVTNVRSVAQWRCPTPSPTRVLILRPLPIEHGGELDALRARCAVLRTVNNAVLNANVELTRLIIQLQLREEAERQ